MKNKVRWIIQSVSGLLLTGSGLSMAIDAGIEKNNGNPWFLYGTISLIIFQIGLCLIADSVRFRN